MSGIGNQGRLAFSYIRMSTDTQLKGHSKQRQLEKSAAYAKVHGLELADESQLEDIGVSAFKGDNVKEGALGQFLTPSKRVAFRQDHTSWLNYSIASAARRCSNRSPFSSGSLIRE